MKPPTLNYASPTCRQLFSPLATLHAAILLFTLLATLWASDSILQEIASLYGTPLSTRSAIFLQNALGFRSGWWLCALLLAPLWGILSPLVNSANLLRPARIRFLSIFPLWLLLLVLFIGAAILQPVLQFTTTLTAKPSPDGPIHCGNWTAVYRWIAQQEELSPDLDTALTICNESVTKEFKLPTGGTLTFIEADYHHELRGVHGNGLLVAVFEDKTGALSIVSPPDMGGNGFNSTAAASPSPTGT